MRDEYNFAEMEGRKNPYASRLKKQVTIRLGADVLDDFKAQNLISLYLRDCVVNGRKLDMTRG